MELVYFRVDSTVMRFWFLVSTKLLATCELRFKNLRYKIRSLSIVNQ